jgi:hypothetical protein
MIEMKKIKFKVIAFCAVVLFFSACTEDGSSPSGDDRSAFTGNWTCSEQSKLYGPASYPVVISLIGDNDSVTIKNFYQLGNAVTAIALISGGSMTIPFQDISGGIKVQGSGFLTNNNSKINLTYYTNDAGVKDTVTATYSK